MKTIKKTIIILLIMIITIYSLIPPKPVQAANAVYEVGQAIADVANDFYYNHASETIYDYTCSFRGQAYLNQKSSGLAENTRRELKEFTNKYAIDCVGFVSMIMHCATGLGDDTFTVFARPTLYNNTVALPKYFEEWPQSTARPGDIICFYDHVAIAVEDGYMIHSAGRGENWEITRDRIDDYYLSDYTVVRVKSTTAADLAVFSDSLRHTWYNGPVTQNPKVYNYISNSTDYYYNGMPLTGEYLGHTDGNWFIDVFENIIDWLVGLMTMGYKIQIVGWTTIIQGLATNLVNSIVSTNEEEKITAESILFNEVQILDINFFNFDTAAGKQINQESVIYQLRVRIANMYYSIRNIAIIVMLIILIYIGIRMAISTVAGQKAIYKKMFFSWCVGFIVIMFIHYFMLVVININNQAIGFMRSADQSIEIYDEVRSYAYEIPASKGWTGALLYVFLIYYMIKLLIFYFKRLLVVDILAIISPIVGISYAIEMIKGKSKSLKTWMKEFSFNVLIQAIHVIIYGLFMNIIYSFMEKVSITSMIPYIVIMILVLNLMLKSEKIIKTIFALKSSTAKDIMNTAIETSATLYTAAAIAKPVKKAVISKINKSYGSNIERRINNKYKNLENSKEDVEKSQLATDIQRQIDKLKEKEANQIKQYDKNAVDLTKNVLAGIGGIVSSVPMTYEAGPVEGAIQLVNSTVTMKAPLGTVGSPYLDKQKIEQLAEKYGVTINQNTSRSKTNKTKTTRKSSSTQNSNNAQGSNNIQSSNNAQGANNTQNSKSNRKAPQKYTSGNTESNKNIKRKLNTKKVSKHTGIKIVGAVGSLATAGTTKRVGNFMSVGLEEKQKLGNPYLTAQIEILYKIQAEVLKEEGILNQAIDNLKGNGFPPVFYEPQEGESLSSIMTNEMLRNKYKKELETNLRQAITGNASITQDSVGDAVENYTKAKSINQVRLTHLKGILKDVATQNGYEVGQDFDNNLKETISINLIDIAQGNKKQTDFGSEAVTKGVMEKVEAILRNHDWNSDESIGQVKTIVTNNLEQEIVQKLSAEQLNSVLTTAINKKGSLKNKQVSPEFEEIVQSATKVAEMETEMAELVGEKYDTEELIESILNENTVNLTNDTEV